MTKCNIRFGFHKEASVLFLRQKLFMMLLLPYLSFQQAYSSSKWHS